MNYPPPRIQDFTALVLGCNIFSCLDLKLAFWQLNVRHGSRKFTCFATQRGNFEFNKMPFGLTFSSFQHFINHVLQGTEAYCFRFIFSPDLSTHKHHLLDIAKRLKAYGLTLSMQKFVPRKAEINILGYHLSANGNKPLDEKIIAIQKFLGQRWANYGPPNVFCGPRTFSVARGPPSYIKHTFRFFR